MLYDSGQIEWDHSNSQAAANLAREQYDYSRTRYRPSESKILGRLAYGSMNPTASQGGLSRGVSVIDQANNPEQYGGSRDYSNLIGRTGPGLSDLPGVGGNPFISQRPPGTGGLITIDDGRSTTGLPTVLPPPEEP